MRYSRWTHASENFWIIKMSVCDVCWMIWETFTLKIKFMKHKYQILFSLFIKFIVIKHNYRKINVNIVALLFCYSLWYSQNFEWKGGERPVVQERAYIINSHICFLKPCVLVYVIIFLLEQSKIHGRCGIKEIP